MFNSILKSKYKVSIQCFFAMLACIFLAGVLAQIELVAMAFSVAIIAACFGVAIAVAYEHS